MIFRHGGKSYPDAQMVAYRTREMDLVIVRAPPDYCWVYILTVDGIHEATSDEIHAFAHEHDIGELKSFAPAAA